MKDTSELLLKQFAKGKCSEEKDERLQNCVI